MKATSYNSIFKHYTATVHNDELNGSPIATVSAAQPMLISQHSVRSRDGSCSATKKQHLKTSGQKLVGVHKLTTAYDMSPLSPSKFGRQEYTQGSNSKQSSYLTYLCTHEFDRPSNSSESKHFAKTPQNISLRSKVNYQQTQVQETFDGGEESDDYTEDDDFDGMGAEDENISDDQTPHCLNPSRESESDLPTFNQVRQALAQNASTKNKNYGSVTSNLFIKEDMSASNAMRGSKEPFALGLRKGSNNLSSSNLDKSSSSSSRQTPQAAVLGRKIASKMITPVSIDNRAGIYKSNTTLSNRDDMSPSTSTTQFSNKDKPLRTFYNGMKVSESQTVHGRKQSNTAVVLQRKNGDKRNKDLLYDKSTSSHDVADGIQLKKPVDHNLSLNSTAGPFQRITVTSKQQVVQQSTFLSNNNSISMVEGPMVPNLMHAAKKCKTIQQTSSSKKKKKKKTAVVKRVTSSTPYGMTGSQPLRFSALSSKESDAIPQRVNLTQQTDYCTTINRAVNQNNENQVNDLGREKLCGPQRSNSINRIPQQPLNKKKGQPLKTTSFANPSTNALSQIINQSQASQSVLGYNKQQVQPLQKKKQWALLDSEKQTYGDRCPRGYEKLDLLGKGGCAIVWLARHSVSGDLVALRQFPKAKASSTADSTARVEVAFGRSLFPKVSSTGKICYGLPPEEFPGIKSIAKLIDDIEENKDYWLVYEVGSQCLSKQLYDVKGEFYKGERIYHIQHQGLFQCIKNNPQVLKTLIRKIAETFDVLSEFKIVHADIKPDNILVNFDGRDIKGIKLIDFGSAFSYENPSSIQASTPEYLSPEVLEYLENRGQNTMANGTNSTNLCKKLQPWSYDVWSLGAILLEILTGFPLWLSLKGRVSTANGKSIIGTGLLGVQGREGKKILLKQQTILKSIPTTLKKYECFGLDKDPDFMDLLYGMLDFNPMRRISPAEILAHPFLTQ